MTARAFRVGMAALALGALAGCDQIGNPLDAISGRIKPPDEFEVLPNKPLRMPSSIAQLPEPRLGERSPLEPNPNADARRALLGGVPTAGSSVSASEAALLGAANTEANKPDIRTALPEDVAAAEAGQGGVPTLAELVGLDGDPVKDALDPDEEARRLQAEGIAPAPVNPDPQGQTTN